jgi:hypothetical protein
MTREKETGKRALRKRRLFQTNKRKRKNLKKKVRFITLNIVFLHTVDASCIGGRIKSMTLQILPFIQTINQSYIFYFIFKTKFRVKNDAPVQHKKI